MKKIIAAAAGLMLAGTMVSSASAVESQFGGYWRTRAVSQQDFNGTDGDFTQADTRTRLYYTAVFNENFKFVNKFEFDNVFGDDVGGDVGADGKIFEVKNSYADFTTGKVRFKVGTQGATIARGFIMADDFSGIYAGANLGDAALLQFLWVKTEEEEAVGTEGDVYGFLPIFTVSDQLSVTPYVIYNDTETNGAEVFWAGADVDFSTDNMSLWGTAIYSDGDFDFDDRLANDSASGWLLAAGGSAGMIHGQAFYASGDSTTDSDVDAFVSAPGQSYYWAEIMGYGIFDENGLTGSPNDKISNVMAANVGVKTKVSEKLTLGGDLWYAALAEDDANGADELGVEVDLIATYAIYDNLNLDLVAAYLFAGDAVSTDGNNEEDPIEVGARLSLAF